jgi:hypothetical protein
MVPIVLKGFLSKLPGALILVLSLAIRDSIQ